MKLEIIFLYLKKFTMRKKKKELQKTMRRKIYSSWVTWVTVYMCVCVLGFPSGSVVKNLPANAGDTRDMGSIPGSGRHLGEGNSNLSQYSCL